MRVRMNEDHGKLVARKTYDLPSKAAKELIRAVKADLVPKAARVHVEPTPEPDPEPETKPKPRSRKSAKVAEN